MRVADYIARRLAALGVRLLSVDVDTADVDERRGATLSMRVGKTVQQWPITTFPWKDEAYTRAPRMRMRDIVSGPVESKTAQAETTDRVESAQEYGTMIRNGRD